MSVDRQLLDAASTNWSNEVDRGSAAAIANPVDGRLGDFDFHFASVSASMTIEHRSTPI